MIGREDDLLTIRDSLELKKQLVLVNGLGGIGKTAIAETYVFKYYSDYKHIVWVNFNEKDYFNSFSEDIGLVRNLDIDTKEMTSQDVFLTISRELKKIEETPSLLIIDNASVKLKEILSYLPHPPNWHLLVTSREEIDGFNIYKLDYLSEQHAVSLFCKYCNLLANEDEILELLKSVEFHTLTIEVLAKTATYLNLSFNEVESAIAKDIKTNIGVAHKKIGKVKRVYTYLSSIFDMGRLSEDELWLMQQMSCLPPEYISYSILKELINPKSTNREEAFSGILNDLVQKGWVQKNIKNNYYKVHRLISQVVVNKIGIEISEIEPLIHEIIGKLHIDQNKDNPVDKFKWISFAKRIEGLFSKSTELPINLIQSKLGIILQEFGDFKEAKYYLKKAVYSSIKNYGVEHHFVASCRSDLALVLEDLGEYENAKKLMIKALNSDIKNFGKNHDDTMVCYSNLAAILRKLGENKKAEKYLEKSYAYFKKKHGEEHPTTVGGISNLGTLYQILGKYNQAILYLEKALQFDLKNYGEEHSNTFNCYSSLGSVYQDLKKYSKAKEYLSKAVSISEKTLGTNHPTTSRLYHNLALVLRELNDYKRAISLLEKSLAILTERLPDNHPDVISTKNSLFMLKLLDKNK